MPNPIHYIDSRLGWDSGVSGMKWFKPKYTVCKQCSVHFEPAPHDEFGEYCPTCREPIREKTNRKLTVINWASQNWERLEEQCLKENKAKHEAYFAQLKNLQNCNSAFAQQSGLYEYGLRLGAY